MKLLVLFFLLFSVSTLIAQSDTNLGFLPKVVLSKKINNHSKWVNSLEQRTFFYDDDFKIAHSLIDFSTIYSTRIADNQSINLGYILRFRNSETIHRTFQHYNFIGSYNALKIANRIAFEQFYRPKKQTTFRTRYRVSLEKPLNGERVDVKEFYLKIGNEYLYDFTDNDLEIRLTPYLGYQVSNKDKIEFGVDYRVGNFLNKATENAIWFRTTWYISID